MVCNEARAGVRFLAHFPILLQSTTLVLSNTAINMISTLGCLKIYIIDISQTMELINKMVAQEMLHTCEETQVFF